MSATFAVGSSIASKRWCRAQALSGLHVLSVVGFGAWVACSLVASPLAIPLGLLVFLVVTAIPMMLRNLPLMLLMWLAGLASVAFPPLAPIVMVVAIVLFIRRIGLILEHWRPVLSGLVAYASAGPVMMAAQALDAPNALDPQVPLIIAISAGTVAALAFHLLLSWQYRYGYSTSTALGLMGVVPLILLALILPFLKLAFEGGAPEVDVPPPSHGLDDLHYTHDYVRADGTHVSGYWARNPGVAARDDLIAEAAQHRDPVPSVGPAVAVGVLEVGAGGPAASRATGLRPIVAFALLATLPLTTEAAKQRLTADVEPVPVESPAEPAAQVSTPAQLARDDVKASLDPLAQRLRACVRSSTVTHFELQVAASGEVDAVDAPGLSAAARDCASKVVAKARFPASPGEQRIALYDLEPPKPQKRPH